MFTCLLRLLRNCQGLSVYSVNGTFYCDLPCNAILLLTTCVQSGWSRGQVPPPLLASTSAICCVSSSGNPTKQTRAPANTFSLCSFCKTIYIISSLTFALFYSHCTGLVDFERPALYHVQFILTTKPKKTIPFLQTGFCLINSIDPLCLLSNLATSFGSRFVRIQEIWISVMVWHSTVYWRCTTFIHMLLSLYFDAWLFC